MKSDSLYIIEVYECLGEDIVSKPEYSPCFETLEECREYCMAENRKNEGHHLEPLKISREEFEDEMRYENEILDRIC